MPKDNPPINIDAKTLMKWVRERAVIIVDVREASEFDFENIPGSVLLPLSFLDPDTFPPLVDADSDRKVVVICAIGKRSAAARKQLADFGLANIHNLEGGLHAWKQAGGETQGGKFEALDYTI